MLDHLRLLIGPSFELKLQWQNCRCRLIMHAGERLQRPSQHCYHLPKSIGHPNTAIAYSMRSCKEKTIGRDVSINTSSIMVDISPVLRSLPPSKLPEAFLPLETFTHEDIWSINLVVYYFIYTFWEKTDH